MRNWPARVIRGVATLNVFLCATGLLLLTFGVERFLKVGSVEPDKPYLHQVFYIYSSVDFLCLVFGLVAAFLLWKLERRGLLLCNLLFGFELLSWIVGATITLVLVSSSSREFKQIGLSLAGASGIGDIGLAPQFVIAYPVLALIALNLAYHKLRNAREHG